MKWRIRSRNRRLLEHALEHDLQLGHRRRRVARWPSIVRQGLNHSLPAPSAPMRACDAVGDDQRRVGREQRRDLRLVGLELLERRPDRRRSRRPAFLSSITASGRPLTNSTTSGRRVCCPSTTVNWLTASQSLFSGLVEVDDARLRAGDRAVRAAVLDRHAVHQHPVHARGCARPATARPPASACGTRPPAPRRAASGLSRASASRSRRSSTTSRYSGSLRSAAGSPAAMSGPCRTA